MAGEPPQRLIAPLLEESLDDLYEHAPCGYLSTLPDGLIVKVNATFLDWTGYHREELVGLRRFQELLTAGGRIYHETHYAPLLRMQGEAREIALQIQCADGRRLPVLISSVLRESEAGEVVRTTVFDASDRRSYERELLAARRRESEARERIERLQQLTEALVGAADEVAVATAALDVLLPALGATGGVVERAGVHLAAAGSFDEGPTEEIDLPGSAGSLGRLRLHGSRSEDRSDADRALLLAAAGQCGQALERAALFAQTERDARRATFLADLGEELARAPEAGERARRLVALLVPALADAARIELAGDPAVHAEAGAVAGGLELSIESGGRRLGQLLVSGPRESPAFLTEVARRSATALENALLYERERQVARTLQESMLTRELPVDPRFLVATHYQPALETMEIGGDWYDAFLLDDGQLAIVVGDVVGRGIAAASAMGQLRSAVRALARAALGPAGVLDRLDGFVEHVDIARSATLVCGYVDLATGRLRYACAGHPPPMLVVPDGAVSPLWDGRSPPLGALPGLPARTDAEIRLPPGARLVLYTDGLVERRDRPIDAGIEALAAALEAHRSAPLADVVELIPRELLAGARVRDDVCMLALDLGA